MVELLDRTDFTESTLALAHALLLDEAYPSDEPELSSLDEPGFRSFKFFPLGLFITIEVGDSDRIPISAPEEDSVDEFELEFRFFFFFSFTDRPEEFLFEATVTVGSSLKWSNSCDSSSSFSPPKMVRSCIISGLSDEDDDVAAQ